MSALHSTNKFSRRLRSDKKARIICDFKEGLSVAGIARKQSVARSTVYRALESCQPSRAGAASEVRVYSRLTREDYVALKAVAQLRGETVSALSRRVLRRASGFFDSDPEISQAALELSVELKKLGSELYHTLSVLMRETRVHSGPDEPKALSAEIRSLQRMVLEAADKVDAWFVYAGRRRLTTVAQLIDKNTRIVS